MSSICVFLHLVLRLFSKMVRKWRSHVGTVFVGSDVRKIQRFDVVFLLRSKIFLPNIASDKTELRTGEIPSWSVLSISSSLFAFCADNRMNFYLTSEKGRENSFILKIATNIFFIQRIHQHVICILLKYGTESFLCSDSIVRNAVIGSQLS